VRLLTLGVDAEGKSCVVEDREVEPVAIGGVPGAAAAMLYGSTDSPPSPGPAGLGRRLEDRLGPGLVSWAVVDHQPATTVADHSATTELHHRNTIDLIVVLAGSGDLWLGDGIHPVSVGDCIVMPGVDHGLRPGPDGCRLMSFSIGASQRETAS